MLKGDLATSPMEIVLADLAAEEATGCLHVVDDDGDEALVYLKSGLVYAVSVPGQRPQLGSRLISSNALVPENLAEALEAQRTELQGWRLGELLVHLGFVEQDVVEAFVQEQVRDGFTDLMAWSSGRWRFRKNEKTREDVAPPTPLSDLLDEVRARQAAWDEIVVSVHGPNAVPMLAARGGEADVTLDSDTWSLLCKIDGERSIADLARECGFTLFEAGTVVRALVEAGLVDVEEDIGPDGDPLLVDMPPDAPVVDGGEASGSTAADDTDDEEFPRVAALAAAFALSGRGRNADAVETVEEFDGTGDDAESAATPSEAPALARVSEAFARAAAPNTDPASFVDPFHVPDEIRLRPAAKPKSAPAKPTEDDLRRDRIRQAAAEELAAAHAEAEAMRKGQSGAAGHIAEVVNLEARRAAAKVEAARIEAERAAAEEAARAEAERLAAERVAAEEAARAEAERLEAERLEAERVAAEEAARTAQLVATQAAAQAAMQAPPAIDPSHLASANAMLAEFSRSGATTLHPSEDAAPEPADEEPTSTLPEPIVQRDLTDTASLLRELSSLGFEDDGPSGGPPARPATPPRPVSAPAAPPKKKKGLFGR